MVISGLGGRSILVQLEPLGLPMLILKACNVQSYFSPTFWPESHTFQKIKALLHLGLLGSLICFWQCGSPEIKVLSKSFVSG